MDHGLGSNKGNEEEWKNVSGHGGAGLRSDVEWTGGNISGEFLRIWVLFGCELVLYTKPAF